MLYIKLVIKVRSETPYHILLFYHKFCLTAKIFMDITQPFYIFIVLYSLITCLLYLLRVFL